MVYVLTGEPMDNEQDFFHKNVETAINNAIQILDKNHPTLANSLKYHNYFIAPLSTPEGIIVAIDFTKTVDTYRTWEDFEYYGNLLFDRLNINKPKYLH